MHTMNKFKYIDLFSGIGGFRQAMEQLGGECILSSEIDSYAIDVYRDNYKEESGINIRDINEKDIPDFDVLCAGFPCQTFSKAGKQLGFKDETKGTLFFDIERILLEKKPKYFILENVRNLVSHDHGNTYKVIVKHLKSAGYQLTKEPLILSPHQFGIPQLRERVIIVGKYNPNNTEESLTITFDKLMDKNDNSIYSIIEKKKIKKYQISDYEEMILNAWDEFYQGINLKVIGFPVWVEYFKKNPDISFPKWKNNFIRKNNELYQNNKDFIDGWLAKYGDLKDWIPTHRKFEWQCGTNIKSVWEGLIQMRPSGIRVKVPTCFPALVAMVQIPIIGKYKRRLSVREAARLQSFPDKFRPCKNDQQAYKQFGNAVNVTVVKECAKQLFKIK